MWFSTKRIHSQSPTGVVVSHGTEELIWERNLRTLSLIRSSLAFQVSRTAFSIIAMNKNLIGHSAVFIVVSSPKCSLLGWLPTGLLIIYNKCFPSFAFISVIWCKLQITLRSIHHSHPPLKVWSKVIALRASGEKIPQFDKICSYAIILPEVLRTDIFLFHKDILRISNIFSDLKLQRKIFSF